MTDTALPDPEARAVILRTARDVLAIFGYRGFTVEAVAARAGVETALVTRWWAGRAELLVDVLADAMAIDPIPDLGNSRDELRLAVTRMATTYSDRGRFQPALLALAADHASEPRILEIVRARCLERGREQVTAALRRAAARGDLPPDVDVDLVHDVWAGAIAYRRLVGGVYTAVEPLLDMVLAGMAPLRAPGRPTGMPPDEPWPGWLRESHLWLASVPFGRIYGLGDSIPWPALAQVPSTVVVAGHTVTISANVSRDFMPPRNVNDTGIMVLVTVMVADTGVLTPFLRADRIAVLHREEVWVAPLAEEYSRGRTSRWFEVRARRGPKWEPGTCVDLVVQLRGEEASSIQLVRLPAQQIDSMS